MTIIYNKKDQKEKRRQLRRKSTKSEKMLWSKLRNRQLGPKFRRQYGIGYYIVDFCSVEKKLIIELDGEVHKDKEIKSYDKEREKNLRALGFKIIRFWNREVEDNLDEVLKRIFSYIKSN